MSKYNNGSILIILVETGNQCYDIYYVMIKAFLNSMIRAFLEDSTKIELE